MRRLKLVKIGKFAPFDDCSKSEHVLGPVKGKPEQIWNFFKLNSLNFRQLLVNFNYIKGTSLLSAYLTIKLSHK